MSSFLGSILIKAGFDLTKYGLIKIFKQDAISKAITATEDFFENIVVSPSLNKWCNSSEFKGVVQSLSNSKDSLSNADIINSYIEIGDFYVEENIEETAYKIITYFAQEYKKAQLITPEGNVLLANQLQLVEQNLLEAIQNQNSIDDEKLIEEIAEKKVLESKVKETSDLIESGKYIYAQGLLFKLREDEKYLTKEIEFKIANNLGVCSLYLNEIATAIDEFEKSLQIEPDNVKVLGNAAMAAYANKDVDTSLELSQNAREIDSQNSTATSVYIQALHKKGKLKEIENLIENEVWILDDLSCLSALGFIYYSDRKFEEAESYLLKALSKDASDWQINNLLSICFFHPIVEQFQNDPPLPWKIDTQIIERLKEAENYASSAIERLKEGENFYELYEVLTNRAQMRSVSGDLEGAIKDCDKVLLQDESLSLTLNTKATVLSKQGKFKEAITCFEKVSDLSIKELGLPSFVAACLNDNQIQRAILLLEEYWDPTSSEERMIRVAESLFLSYSRLSQTPEDKLEEIFEYLVEKWGDNTQALMVIPHFYVFKNQYEKAAKTLQKALENATNNQRDYIHLSLADLAFDQQNASKALEYYSLILNLNAPLRIKQNYAICLFNEKRYTEVLEFTQSLRNGGNPIPIISEIEVRVLEYSNDLPKALNLRLNLHKSLGSESEEHLINAFMLAIRLGKDEEAEKIILQVDLNKIQNNPWSLSHVAQAYTLIGIEGGIPLAYNARKFGFNLPQYHLAYLRVFLAREDSEAPMFRPEVVKNNCVVEVSLSTGEKQTYLITNEEKEEKEKGIVSLNDPIAQKFLGKKKGDTAILKESELENLKAEILEVKSKYVYAFQETFSKFSTWFPEDENLYRVKIKDKDFSVIFSQIDKKYAHVRSIMQLHKENRLPLSLFADLLRVSQIKAWGKMINGLDSNVFASQGNINDINGKITSKNIVLGLVGILSANYLGILDKLESIFDKVYVPQSVLDEINEDLLNEKIDSKTKASISRTKEGYYDFYEFSENDIQAYVEFLSKLKTFIIEKTEIIPLTGALDRDNFDDLAKLLGDGVIASIFAADDLNALLYADDLGINFIAEKDWNVTTIWSQVILSKLKKDKILTDKEYSEGIYKLAVANYKFLTFTISDLEYAVRKNNWEVSVELERFMRAVEGCNEDWLVNAFSELLKQSSLETLQEQKQLFFLDFIIKTLIKGRESSLVLEKLGRSILSKFNLLPIHSQIILQTIELWQQAPLSRE